MSKSPIHLFSVSSGNILPTVFLILTIGFGLASCGKQDETVEVVKPVVSENVKSSEFSKIPVSERGSVDSLSKITTVADLESVDSSAMGDQKNSHPRFVEFRKKQLILWAMIARIQTPEYLTLQNKISDMEKAKEIWSPELIELDSKIEGFVGTSSGSDAFGNPEYRKLVWKRNELLSKLANSAEYSNYVRKSQPTIDSLSKELNKYYPEEVLKLQREVRDMRKEIYG